MLQDFSGDANRMIDAYAPIVPPSLCRCGDSSADEAIEMPVWKPMALVIIQVRVKGTVSGPVVTFWHRPYGYGHRLTI